MKLQKYPAALFITISLLINSSCTRMFEEYNTDPTGYSEELQKLHNYWYAIPLMNFQQGIYFNYDWGEGRNWPFQIMQNLNIDLFAGYFHNYTFKDAAFTNSMYDLNDGWNAAMWEYTYWYVIPEGKKAEERSRNAIPEFYAVTKILKVQVLHRISDIYGPIMYQDYGENQIGGTPDSQKEAYYAFFEDLDMAYGILKEHIDSDKFRKFDFLMPENHRNSTQWLKYVNSLRLRLAIRISKVDPEKGKTEAAKSFSSEFGFLERTDEVVAVSTTGTGYTNPLGEINKAWGEVYMNANMESILSGYQDPRLQRFFEPASDERIKGQFKGIRQGTGFTHDWYQGHSKSSVTQTLNALLMTSAEVWFLRAEAALRGWTNECPKNCYEQGVRVSFSRWRADGVEKYLNSQNTAADYTDIFDADYNIQTRCKVCPKWDESDTNEEKLEKIITQKWIACYPEGCEAWAEQRRTGYPRLFPVLFNMSNGIIDSEVMIRRLNFPASIKRSNPDLYDMLSKKLDGADNAATRLWWDTGKPNF